MNSDDSLSKIRCIHGLMKREAEELLRLLQLNKKATVETTAPHIDVMIGGDKVFITAELPGIDSDDFTVYLYEDLLILEGIRRRYCTDKKIFFLRMERDFAPFKRILQLPFSVNKDNVKALLKNGVLSITLFKAEMNEEGTSGTV